MPPTTPASAPPAAPENPEEKIRRLPAEAQSAFRRFQKDGDLAALDPVVFAILEDFMPRRPDQPLAGYPGDTLLVDTLGFDSLAITEVVFFTEDLFGISIANEEIIRVRTLDDLRGFVRAKVAARPPA
jgi:hypothetical protein